MLDQLRNLESGRRAECGVDAEGRIDDSLAMAFSRIPNSMIFRQAAKPQKSATVNEGKSGRMSGGNPPWRIRTVFDQSVKTKPLFTLFALVASIGGGYSGAGVSGWVVPW
jgi:hypothetical protein